jgi:hypothetical protein
MTVEEQAAHCQSVLGQRLTAYAVNERNPAVVGRWARGEATPHS